MITPSQRKELERIKPPKYREKVKNYLAEEGYNFSLETIQKVYSGKRKNMVVAQAISTVFNRHMIEQEKVRSKIDAIIANINKDIS